MRDAGSDLKFYRKRRLPGEVLLRDRVAYLALRAVSFTIRTLPVEAGAALMGAVWRTFGPRTRQHGRALQNLALAFPETRVAERQEIAVEHWDNLGRTFAEAIQLDRIVADPARIELRTSPQVDAALSRPGPIIAACMHSGNWELLGPAFRRFRKLATIYKPNTNPLINQLVLRTRAPWYEGGLFTPGHGTPASLMRWVRDGNGLGVLVDRHERGGIEVDFFGMAVKVSPFPALLARRLGAPLFVARVIRLPGSRFRVEAVEVEAPPTGSAEAQIAALTQAVHRQLEIWIRERPGEWSWQQRRWRGKPASNAPESAASETLPASPTGPNSP